MAGVICEKNKTKDDYFITNCKEKKIIIIISWQMAKKNNNNKK